jgi:hypothetical protein
MRKYTAAFLLTVAVAACGGGASDDATVSADTAARQVDLAPPPAAEPQLADAPAPEAAPATPAPRPRPQPAAPRPTAPEPEPAAPARPAPTPAARIGTVAAGTSFAVSTGSRVCTNTHKVGDRFTATLAEPVSGTNGATIPAGATVVLEVRQAVVGENDRDKAALTFAPVSVAVGGASYPVDGAIAQLPIERVRRQSTTDQAKKVATGAAVGALIGQIAGKNTKSTVIGGAVGAAAGQAVARGTADYDACVATGARLAAQLEAPLSLRVN